ncbi:hypothetical protein [Sporosarcina sp. NPDC096371]|uniref:hypothetical protein n=1 Tax=Sporosarcina sp. NPDC096371 TaxID=3364530 RepID=UPI00380ED3C0
MWRLGYGKKQMAAEEKFATEEELIEKFSAGKKPTSADFKSLIKGVVGPQGESS